MDRRKYNRQRQAEGAGGRRPVAAVDRAAACLRLLLALALTLLAISPIAAATSALTATLVPTPTATGTRTPLPTPPVFAPGDVVAPGVGKLWTSHPFLPGPKGVSVLELPSLTLLGMYPISGVEDLLYIPETQELLLTGSLLDSVQWRSALDFQLTGGPIPQALDPQNPTRRPGTAEVWVPSMDSNFVAIYDALARSFLGSFTAGTSSRSNLGLRFVSFVRGGAIAYVSDWNDQLSFPAGSAGSLLHKVDAATRTVLTSIATGEWPRQTVADMTEQYLLVPNQIGRDGDGDIDIVDLGTDTVVTTINLPACKFTTDASQAGPAVRGGANEWYVGCQPTGTTARVVAIPATAPFAVASAIDLPDLSGSGDVGLSRLRAAAVADAHPYRYAEQHGDPYADTHHDAHAHGHGYPDAYCHTDPHAGTDSGTGGSAAPCRAGGRRGRWGGGWLSGRPARARARVRHRGASCLPGAVGSRRRSHGGGGLGIQPARPAAAQAAAGDPAPGLCAGARTRAHRDGAGNHAGLQLLHQGGGPARDVPHSRRWGRRQRCAGPCRARGGRRQRTRAGADQLYGVPMIETEEARNTPALHRGKGSCMKRRLIVVVAVALIGGGLFTAAQALRAHFGRRTVAARGWWSLGAPGVPGQAQEQRWQMVFSVAADGSLHGRGEVQGGGESAEANVLGQVNGHQLSATIVSEEGVQLVILNGVTTPAGASGTFVTAAGDAGTWASTQHEIGAPHEADEPGDDDDDDGGGEA